MCVYFGKILGQLYNPGIVSFCPDIRKEEKTNYKINKKYMMCYYVGLTERIRFKFQCR